MAKKNIHESICGIMAEIEAIGKGKKNQQQGFMYRGIDDLYNDLQPRFAKHEVFITSEVLSKSREERSSKNGGALIWTIIDMKFTFHAADGSSLSSTMIGEAMDSGDKGANKAMSIALKYCLFQMFLIPTEDGKNADPDATVHELSQKQSSASRPAAPQPQKQPQKTPPASARPDMTKIEQHWFELTDNAHTAEDLSAIYNANKSDIDGRPDLIQLFADRQQWITIRDGVAKCDSVDKLKKFYDGKKTIIDARADLKSMLTARKK